MYKYYYSDFNSDLKWINIIDVNGKTVAHVRIAFEDCETNWREGGYDLIELIELAKTCYIVNEKWLKLKGVPLYGL